MKRKLIVESKMNTLPIEKIKEEIANVYLKVKIDYFIPFFKSLKEIYRGDLEKRTPKIIVKNIKIHSDLKSIPNERGFYLIFTDYKKGFQSVNKCKCVLKDNPNARVIYRGESYNVRTRLESHLFHELYHKKRVENKKRSDNYNVCLKLENEENINLDSKEEVNKANWYVAYHALYQKVMGL